LCIQGHNRNHVMREVNEGVGYTDQCSYTVQNKAWFDEEVFLEWIEDYWRPFLDSNGIKWTYLLLNECTVHLTTVVKEVLTQNNTEFDYMVPGYTSKLQPLDVGVNGRFKSYMKNNVESFMVINNHGTNAIKIHCRDVPNWVADCWALVTETTIQNS
jgi:DDE superfamily endonuclease